MPISPAGATRAIVTRASLVRLGHSRERMARALVASVGVGFVAQIFLLISGVVLARILGPTDRGLIGMFALISLFVTQLASLGFPSAVAYFLSTGPLSRDAVLVATRSVLVLQLPIAVSLQVGLMASYAHVVGHVPWVPSVMVIVWAPLLIVQDTILAVLQGMRNYRVFSLTRLLPSAASATGALVIVLFPQAHNITTATAIVVLAAAVTTALMAGILRRSVGRDRAPITMDAPLRTARTMLRFGLKGSVGNLYPIEVLRLDQAAVGLLLSPAALGLYVVAGSFSNLSRFLAQGISAIALPHVASAANAPAGWRSLQRFVVLTTVSSMALWVVSWPFMTVGIRALYGERYVAAAPVAVILLLAASAQAVRRVACEAAKGLGFPLIGTVAELLSWPPFVLIIGFAVRSHQLVAVAWATVGAAVVALLVAVLAYPVIVQWAHRMNGPEPA